VPYGYTGTRKSRTELISCLVCCLDIMYCPWERLACHQRASGAYQELRQSACPRFDPSVPNVVRLQTSIRISDHSTLDSRSPLLRTPARGSPVPARASVQRTAVQLLHIQVRTHATRKTQDQEASAQVSSPRPTDTRAVSVYRARTRDTTHESRALHQQSYRQGRGFSHCWCCIPVVLPSLHESHNQCHWHCRERSSAPARASTITLMLC
jgi:hypothetical protein